jgi:hypothetical protein
MSAHPGDAKDPDTSFPAMEPLRPPTDAPNVLIIMLDDVGSAPRRRSCCAKTGSTTAL